MFAAGLVARSLHEFIELGWLPALIEQVWNTTAILNEESVLGQVAKSLLGYRTRPSLAEVIGYTSYLLVVLALLWRANRTPSSSPAKSSGAQPA